MWQDAALHSTGIIFWGLLTGCINEGATVFISAEAFIRNVPTPLSVHFYRMMARNVIIWVFNMAIYLAVVVYFGLMPHGTPGLLIPGFILFLINARYGYRWRLGCSSRYRDIPQIVANLIQVVLFPYPVSARRHRRTGCVRCSPRSIISSRSSGRRC